MAASPYLLRIIAKPANEAVGDWMKWYKSEGLPETLSNVTATRTGLYHAYNNFELQTKTPLDGEETELHEMKLSQTIDLEPPGDKVVLVMAQIESIDDADEIFRRASPPTEGAHAAVADIRLYRLIEDFDPRKLGHRKLPSQSCVACRPRKQKPTHSQNAPPSSSTCKSNPPTSTTTIPSTRGNTSTCSAACPATDAHNGMNSSKATPRRRRKHHDSWQCMSGIISTRLMDQSCARRMSV